MWGTGLTAHGLVLRALLRCRADLFRYSGLGSGVEALIHVPNASIRVRVEEIDALHFLLSTHLLSA